MSPSKPEKLKELRQVGVWITAPLKRAWEIKLREDGLTATTLVTYWIRSYTGFKEAPPDAETEVK